VSDDEAESVVVVGVEERCLLGALPVLVERSFATSLFFVDGVNVDGVDDGLADVKYDEVIEGDIKNAAGSMTELEIVLLFAGDRATAAAIPVTLSVPGVLIPGPNPIPVSDIGSLALKIGDPAGAVVIAPAAPFQCTIHEAVAAAAAAVPAGIVAVAESPRTEGGNAVVVFTARLS
jgi:hypothetical protein